MLFVSLLGACLGTVQLGDLVLTEREDGGIDVSRYDGKSLLTDLRFALGAGDEAFEFQAGAYREASGTTTWSSLTLANRRGEGLWLYDLVDDAGTVHGQVTFIAAGTRTLEVEVSGEGTNRVRFDAACTGSDHFVGGGEHAMDVDHVGEAFELWVSEPGIGKSETDDTPEAWFLTGTRHATSYPDPFFVRPEPLSVEVLTDARVGVDLCTGDRWRFDAWSPSATLRLTDADSPLALVQAHALAHGTPAVPPDWAFGAWADAVRGAERVLAVAAELRGAGAAATVIWSEDWRGGEEGSFGYHPKPEWQVDETLYPDPSGIDAALEAAGFKWLAYFAPFLVRSSSSWDEALPYAIQDAEGAPYLFLGPSFEDTTSIDLSDPNGYDWVVAKLSACAEVGFDGWMADYAEWLPTDATIAVGDAEVDHNLWPVLWQQASVDALQGRDAAWFARSGWTGASTLAPVHWPGDQRTSFDADDGFPTVVPLTLGGSIAGVAVSGSDIAGYQSVGNDPSTKELWMRWAGLGAFSPIMRTHHGAFSTEDWQFDSDEETLAAFATYSRVHAGLFPYLRGLAQEAVDSGTPMVRPLFLHHPAEQWGRMDAWLLGPSLLVNPITEAGVTAWSTDLPTDREWYDWWTGEAVGNGTVAASVDWLEIPVFAPAGAVVPTFADPPDSLVDGPLEGLRTLSDADRERTIYVFAGRSGAFEEADGTRYETDGNADAAGTTTATMAAGELSAGGLTLRVDGDVERSYTLIVRR